MSARFVKSAMLPKGFPTPCSKEGTILPEIAVVGRSNVGKSSLLNHLFQTKHLVKTSATPGKTQLLNFFCYNETLFFVDFPGYGYAKVPDYLKKRFFHMANDYFTTRQQLSCILYLFDARRTPKEEDIALLQWLQETGKPVIGILTKIDKLPKTKRLSCKKQLETLFNHPFLLYSATKNLGRQELLGALHAFIGI